jgi:biotin transport system substrate-specific component
VRARPLPPLAGGLSTLIALCLAAPVSFDVGPVPVTLQSLIMCLAGALAGGAGVAGVIIWLALAAMGLPVLAGMNGGMAAMGGASAGFLIGLPLAARLAMRWQPDWSWRRTLWLMLGAHALLLVLGSAGLALRGIDVRVLLPLLPGAGVKSLAAMAVLQAASRRQP